MARRWVVVRDAIASRTFVRSVLCQRIHASCTPSSASTLLSRNREAIRNNRARGVKGRCVGIGDLDATSRRRVPDRRVGRRRESVQGGVDDHATTRRDSSWATCAPGTAIAVDVRYLR